MLANFLGKSKPINFIVLLLLFICAFFLNLGSTFFILDFTLSFIVEKAGIFLLFLAIFFTFNFIVSKNNLTLDNSYAFLFYLLLTLYFYEYLLDYQVLLSCFVTLLFLRKIYSLQTLKDIFKKLFDAGFWLGIMFFFNPYLILFFLLIIIALIVHKRVRFQTIMIPIVGFMIPIFLFFTYSLWNDKVDLFINRFLFHSTHDFSLYLENRFSSPLVMISIFLISAILIKSGSVFSVNDGFKKNWILLLFHLLISISCVFFTFEKDGSELLIAIFPIAIITTNGFEMLKNKLLKEVLLILFIASSFLIPIFL